MSIKYLKSLVRPIKSYFQRNPDNFLSEISGVIHIGANIGQERYIYDNYGLSVIWIEPIPKIFQELKSNITQFNSQFAFQELITDEDNKEYEFNISNNSGESSSILELRDHKYMWSNIYYCEKMTMQSITLPTLISKVKIDIKDYQALILDTQGSELLILEGCNNIIAKFKYIKLEVADFESYLNCCQLSDVAEYMEKHNFREYSRTKFISNREIGNYFDIIYKKV